MSSICPVGKSVHWSTIHYPFLSSARRSGFESLSIFGSKNLNISLYDQPKLTILASLVQERVYRSVYWLQFTHSLQICFNCYVNFTGTLVIIEALLNQPQLSFSFLLTHAAAVAREKNCWEYLLWRFSEMAVNQDEGPIRVQSWRLLWTRSRQKIMAAYMF